MCTHVLDDQNCMHTTIFLLSVYIECTYIVTKEISSFVPSENIIIVTGFAKRYLFTLTSK